MKKYENVQLCFVPCYAGFVNGYSAEYDVVNSIVNNASNLSLNVSVVLNEFNATEKKNLFNLGKIY